MGPAGEAFSERREQPRGQPANRGQWRRSPLPAPPTPASGPATGTRRARKEAWRKRLLTPLPAAAFSNYPVQAEAATLERAWLLLRAAAELRGVPVQLVPADQLDGATGRFLPEQRLIQIAELGDAGAAVVTLAHEMGHVHDPWWSAMRASLAEAERRARDLRRFPFLQARSEIVAQEVALAFCRSYRIDAEAWSEVYLLDWSASTWWGRRDVERRATRAWASLSGDLATVSRD